MSERWVYLLSLGAAAAIVCWLELRSPSESFADEFLLLVAGDKTHYGPEYSHEGFAAIELGDSFADVQELVGPPLSGGNRRPDGWLVYSIRTVHGANFRIRSIRFEDGVVAEIMAKPGWVWVIGP